MSYEPLDISGPTSDFQRHYRGYGLTPKMVARIREEVIRRNGSCPDLDSQTWAMLLVWIPVHWPDVLVDVSERRISGALDALAGAMQEWEKRDAVSKPIIEAMARRASREIDRAFIEALEETTPGPRCADFEI